MRLRADFKFDESNAKDRSNNPTDADANANNDNDNDNDDDDNDDEYSASAGIVDPKLLITTSRSPSSRLSQFSKELRLLFPLSVRLNRGNAVLPQLVEGSHRAGITDLLVLHEHRGVPTSLTVSHFPHGPTVQFSLHNVVLRHDIQNSQRGTVSEAYPHLIFEGFTTRLGKRIVTILKNLFPAGVKRDSSRVVTFKLCEGDYISVRHHVFVKTGFNSVELAEVGPRMEMKVRFFVLFSNFFFIFFFSHLLCTKFANNIVQLFEIKLGLVDNKHADYEWRLANYTRTAKKRDLL